MRQWRPVTICVVLLALIGLSVWGLCGLTREASIAIQKWGNAAPTMADKSDVKNMVSTAVAKVADAATKAIAGISGAAADALKKYGVTASAATGAIKTTSATLNRPCQGKAGPDACGTLAQVNKTLVKVGDEITTTQLEQRAAIPHVIAAMDTLNSASGHIGDVAKTLNDRLASQTVTDAAANFARTVKFAADITESGAGIMADGKKVADKETADFLKPTRWYMQPVKKASDILDIGAAVARHTP